VDDVERLHAHVLLPRRVTRAKGIGESEGNRRERSE
jgi:hypothetical protein